MEINGIILFLIIIFVIILLIYIAREYLIKYEITDLHKRIIKIEFPLVKSVNLLDSLKDIPRKVIIDKADLGLCIEYFRNIYSDKSGWKASLPFAVAMLIVFFTTNIDENKLLYINQIAGSQINKDQVSIMFIIILTISILWITKDIFKYFISGNSYVKLFDKIKENSINKPDYTSIFIFKKIENNKKYILVEYKSTWNCFFLPYYKETGYYERNDNKFLDKLSRKIKNLGCNISIIDIGINKHTEKYDPPENIVKDYNFSLYSITDCNRLDFMNYELDNSVRTADGFFWIEFNDLLMDERTIINNRDIILLLLENRTQIFDENKDYYDAE